MKFSGKVGDGSVNKRLNFGGDPDHEFKRVPGHKIHQASHLTLITQADNKTIRESYTRCIG